MAGAFGATASFAASFFGAAFFFETAVFTAAFFVAAFLTTAFFAAAFFGAAFFFTAAFFAAVFFFAGAFFATGFAAAFLARAVKGLALIRGRWQPMNETGSPVPATQIRCDARTSRSTEINSLRTWHTVEGLSPTTTQTTCTLRARSQDQTR